METAPTGSLGQKRPRIRPDQMTAAQTVLESFGNARTMKNNNASRFGNVTELLYKQLVDAQSNQTITCSFNRGSLCGIHMKDFLLEKSRVIMQNAGERNFHIFYEMCSGLPNNTKIKFGIKPAHNYFYLNQVQKHYTKLSHILEKLSTETFESIPSNSHSTRGCT
jgi:myosin heavy subunit